MGKDLGDAAFKTVADYLKAKINELPISKEMKLLLVYMADNAKALSEFAIAYAKQKATGSIKPNDLLLAFLKSKGKSIKDFGIKAIDDETLSDANAVVNLLVFDIPSSVKYSEIPVFGVALTIGFLINDAGKFLANFTPAQVAYYNLVLKSPSTTYRVEPYRIQGPKY